jgi:four helix bundle protein
VKSHADLDVWKRAVDLAADVYKVTASFPAEEKFGLVSQMRRSAVSIASNIAEGAARTSRREFMQFLSIASGSASELVSIRKLRMHTA